MKLPPKLRHRDGQTIALGAIALIGLLSVSSLVFAYSNGITSGSFDGQADGCNECHNGGSDPIATLNAALSVTRGDTLSMTLLLEGGAAQHGGLNVSIDQDAAVATLSPGSNTAIRAEVGNLDRNEIVHNAPLEFATNLSVAFELQTAADAPCDTPVNINAWGNAVNNDGDTSGDRASRDTVDILIVCNTDALFTSGFE